MSATQITASYDHHRGAKPLLQRSSHWRTGIFSVLNLAGLVAACVFWRHLSTGRWVDFSPAAWLADLATPLGESLLHPLSVVSHPWMILIAGLLLAVAIFVPLITAVLYPVVVSLALVLVVAVMGHVPILATAIGVGCVMASRTQLRSDMPFCAVVLGLVPVGLYLWLLGYSDSQAAEVLPLQRWVLVGPMLIAIVATVLSTSASLGLARATRFRPGVVAPVLALLLAAPAAIFHLRIGEDELAYALIAERVAPGDVIFQPEKLDQWRQRHRAEGLNPRTLEISLRDDLQSRQRALSAECESFLARHGQSDRAASVHWLAAQCRSLQLDVPVFEAGVVRYSASFPLPASRAGWRRILEGFGTTDQAALAQWRLGELALRRQDFAQADELLHAAEGSLARRLAADKGPSRGEIEGAVFRPPESIPNAGYFAQALFRIRRLIWLMQRNEVLSDTHAGEALAAMLNESPHQPDYDERLGSLVSIYEKTTIGDNLKLAVAMATTDPYIQAEMLIWLAADERTDAAVEANYQLGMLVMQTARARALMLVPRIKKPEEYFQIVIASPPNPWQDLARGHLARLMRRPPSELARR